MLINELHIFELLICISLRRGFNIEKRGFKVQKLLFQTLFTAGINTLLYLHLISIWALWNIKINQ